jgi:hypothetical protein
MHQLKLFTYFVLLLGFISNCYGVYFLLEEGKTRCFLEEAPKSTLIVGKYTIEESNANVPQKPGVKVEVKDPQGNQILQQNLQPKGKFAFTTSQGGEHTICFQTNTTRWFGTRQVMVCSSFITKSYSQSIESAH